MTPEYEDTRLRFKATPGSELAALRDEAHRAFDVFWQFYPTGRLRFNARRRAYAWLAVKLGRPVRSCHFGMFDEATCREAIRLLREEGPQACLPPSAT